MSAVNVQDSSGAFLFWSTCALLMFGPLAFGAVEPWSILTLRCGTALLFMLWAGKQVASGRFELRWNPLYGPMLLFGLLIVIQIGFKISAYSYATLSEGLNYVAYGIIVLLLTQHDTHARLRGLALALTVFGFLVALFAVVQDFTANDKLYWLRTPRGGGAIFGPYVNHSHYAGLMEMLTPIPLVTYLRPHLRGGRKVLWAFAALLMGASIFLSRSRGGMLAFAAALGLLGFLLYRPYGNRQAALVSLLVGVVLLGFALWIDTGALFGRLQTLRTPWDEMVSGARLSVVKDSPRLIAERPIAGWGLGLFPVVYPQYRSSYSDLFMNQAHNDFLQLLVETGVIGFAIMGWFLWVVFRRGLRKGQNWNSRPHSALRLAALVGIFAILVHSLFDFNMHIPANAALFFALCAIVVADVPREARDYATELPGNRNADR